MNKYPENASDVLRDLTVKDWVLILAVSIALGVYFVWIAPAIIWWLIK